MNLTGLSPALFGLGLAALAGVLFWLQRLRVRYREQVVLTTLFWQEAKEEARARSLMERFRHPLAYLLALLLVGLAWLGFAQPEGNDRAGTQYTVILDGSMEMGAGDHWQAAKQAVWQAAAGLPRQRTRVLVAGAGLRTLLAPGEDRGRLARRLENLQPSATPSSLARAAHRAARSPQSPAASDQHVIAIGSPDSWRGEPWTETEGVVLTRRTIESADEGGRLARLAALGIAETAQAWDTVDVLVRVRETGTIETPLRVRVGEEDWLGSVARTSVNGETTYTLTGVPADGSELVVRLGDGAEPVGRLRLPSRPTIRVFVDPSIESEALRAALDADPALQQVEQVAASDVVMAGSLEAHPDRPALRWVPAAEQPYAFFVVHEPDWSTEEVFAMALGEFGLDRVDANEWATQVGQAIELGAQEGEVRQLHLWQELLDASRFGFTESRGFPILIGRSLRWLAQAEGLVPYLAAGSPVPQELSHAGEAFASATTAMPLQAGTLDTGGVLASASWLDGLSGTVVRASADGQAALPREGSVSLMTWVLLLLAALVLLEWGLYSRGLIP